MISSEIAKPFYDPPPPSDSKMTDHTSFRAPESHSGRLLSMKQVLREVPVHRATIYKMMARNEFPQPVQLSRRRVAWWESDIEAFKAQKPVSSAPTLHN